MVLLFLTAAVLAGLGLAGRALPWERRGPVRGAMIAVAGLYAGALLALSLASREQVLVPGQVKHFCGFYFDCHLGVSVGGVRRMSRIDAPGETLEPRGVFYRVELVVSSNARRATLALDQPRAVVMDDAGRRYQPLTAGLAALSDPVPAGFADTAVVIFDLPADVRHPRLLVTEGAWLDQILESVLIGDDDSLLHAPTTLALVPPS